MSYASEVVLSPLGVLQCPCEFSFVLSFVVWWCRWNCRQKNIIRDFEILQNPCGCSNAIQLLDTVLVVSAFSRMNSFVGSYLSGKTLILVTGVWYVRESCLTLMFTTISMLLMAKMAHMTDNGTLLFVKIWMRHCAATGLLELDSNVRSASDNLKYTSSILIKSMQKVWFACLLLQIQQEWQSTMH